MYEIVYDKHKHKRSKAVCFHNVKSPLQGKTIGKIWSGGNGNGNGGNGKGNGNGGNGNGKNGNGNGGNGNGGNGNGKTKKSCERIPYKSTCRTGRPSQFTLRWYVRDGMCCSYPYGHCKVSYVAK